MASINPFYCPGLYVGGLTTVTRESLLLLLYLFLVYVYKKHGTKGKKERKTNPRI